MRPLSAAELLDVWERGLAASPWHQALLLLRSACPESTFDELAQTSIGRRDMLLLQLRSWLFGSQLHAVVDCPDCRQRLEFDLDSSLILASHPPELAQPVIVEGLHILLRPPNSADLEAIVREPDPDAARLTLLSRCVVEVTLADDDTEWGPDPPSPQALPPAIVSYLSHCLAELDPMADVQLAMVCEACGHEWSTPFDVAFYFWREIDDWARRTLRDVHILARAYGWRESDILSMSAWRRRAYLQMVAA